MSAYLSCVHPVIVCVLCYVSCACMCERWKNARSPSMLKCMHTHGPSSHQTGPFILC